MSGWTYNGRDVLLLEDGAALGLGDLTWAEKLSPSSAGAAKLYAVGDDSYSPYGIVGASRTSGRVGGGLAVMALSLQDKTDAAGGAWANYSEAFVARDAHPDGTQMGHEYAVINKRATCGDVDPVNINTPGSVTGVRIGVGKPGEGGQEISAIMTTVNAEGFAGPKAVARKGFVFHKWGHKYVRGFAEVLSMAKDMVFRWYDDTARVSASIQGCVDNADHAVHVRFTNGAIHFLDENEVAQFSFNCKTGNLYLGNTGWSTAPLKRYVGSVSIFVGGRPLRVPLYED